MKRLASQRRVQQAEAACLPHRGTRRRQAKLAVAIAGNLKELWYGGKE